MRRLLATLAAVLSAALSVSVPATRADAYAFLYVPSSQGVPRRWNLPELADGRVPWVIAAAVGGNVTGDRSPLDVVSAAFASWEVVTSSTIAFGFQGTTGARERSARDGVNLVTLGAQESLGSGVLAATFLTSDAAGKLVDVDIVFGRGIAFSTSVSADPGSYDLEAIATHEVGHFLGLEHSGLSRATMVPFSDRGDAHQRTPESDDRIGASVLYPADGFLAGTGALAGRITIAGAPVFLSHVVVANVNGPIVASTLSAPDGSYRVEGLAPDVYVVYAEPLDGPVAPGNVSGFRAGFGGNPSTGYGTFFH